MLARISIRIAKQNKGKAPRAKLHSVEW